MAKRILKEIKLTEISGVDRPAQPNAKMTIMKRDTSKLSAAIAKYYDGDPGKAVSFNEIEDKEEAQRKIWQIRDKLYPYFEAINTSITSIVADKSLTSDQKSSRISESCNQFAIAILSEFPEVEDELIKFLNKAGSSGSNQPEEVTMTAEEIEKKIADAVAEAVAKSAEEKAELEKALEVAKSVADLSAEDLAFYKAAKSDEDKEAFLALSDEEKKKKREAVAKSDEVVVFEGREVRKSVDGETVFQLAKRAAEFEKSVKVAEEKAELALLEKRAAEKYGKLPGTDAEKAKVIKAYSGLDKEIVAYLDALFDIAEKGNSEAFEKKGSEVKKSADEDVVAKRNEKIAEIQKRDNVSRTVAMERVVKEAPELFEEDK